MKKLVSFALVFMFLGSSVFAQNVTKEAVNEVIRRGNHVEVIDGIQQSDEISDVMAPPALDDNKWFISLITQSGCAACERLKYDFANARPLQAWVDVANPSKSFTHYNIYRVEDRTQDWQFKNVRFKGVPTVVIQPPRNGQYGNPSTVVKQLTGYDGNPENMANQIRSAIVNYVKALEKRPRYDGYEQTEGGLGQRRDTPPFLPPPQDVPFTPNDNIIPPELDNDRPELPDFLSDTPVSQVWGGVKQIASGVFTIFWKGLQTLLLVIILVLLVTQITKKKSVNVVQDAKKQTISPIDPS